MVINCKSFVYIEPVPESFPVSIEKIILEKIDFTEIPESEEKKIIINTYTTFIHDIRWRIRDLAILLINGNITGDEHNDAVRPLYEDLSLFTDAFEKYKKSLEDDQDS